MSPAPRAIGVRLGALHAATFVGVGVYLPFFPVWLRSEALNPAVIGLIVATPIIVRIVATVPLLTLAERSIGLRRLLMAGHAGQMVGYPLLMMVDDGWLIAGIVALIAVAQAAIIPGNDLATIRAVQGKAGLHYGRLRVWGSIAFLCTSIATGYLIDALGAGIVLWALFLTPLAAMLATHLALPRDVTASEPARQAPAAGGTHLSGILWLVMIAAALIQSSHGGLYAFGSIHWRSIGFSDAVIGYFWALGVLAEIVVFFLFGQGVGRGSAGLGLMLAGGSAAAVRFAVLSTDPGLAVTFIMQALHGLTFGATHLGAMAALAALAPESARARVQGVYGSVLALSSAAVAMASGPLYGAVGPGIFAVMAPLGLAAVAILIVAAGWLKRQPQRAGEGG